ncbi:MAG: ADP-ribosylglycohydrolase family protein [Chloroflexota bacterium]
MKNERVMRSEKIIKAYPANVSQRDRIVGAIVGAFIGDALGVGCQWYYDLAQLRQDFGPWIDNYVDPKVDSLSKWGKVLAHRHRKGVRAGDGSQTATFMEMLLESVAANKGYGRYDYTHRIDAFLQSLDGEPDDPYAGIWTDEMVRVVRKARLAGISWDDPDFQSPADGSDCAQRGVILAAAYRNPAKLAKLAHQDMRLFFQNRFIVGHQLTYVLFVQTIINGVPLEQIGAYLQKLGDDHQIMQYVVNFDTIDSPRTAVIAWDPDYRLEPASKICKVYGLACQATFLLPAAYYLAYRYPNDFETAVLSAINGGGNNMARATLTGGIVGAMVGIQGIPEKFISGLNKGEKYLKLAQEISDFAVGNPNYQFVDYNPNDDSLPHSADI